MNVTGSLTASARLNHRRLLIGKRSKRPEFLLHIIDRRHVFWLWPGRFCALIEPGFDYGDIFGRQWLPFSLRRHFARRDPLDNQAFSGFSRDNRGATVAAFRHQPHEPQVEFSLVLLLIAVALK